MRLGDRYELRQPIASGGMAQVWAATDTLLDRQVAAKVLHPHLSTDAGFVERFRREAVAAASLSHSSIVSIFDTISENGLEAIVMELIDGRTLRSILDDIGAMPAVDVVHFGSQIAAALDEAHRAGIVHRDIKPANIMICPDRRVMVTDFGIAKAGSDADLTQTGTLLGTAKYLAPEQVTGEEIDPRSDLYSLGVVMFEALTGTVPFKANTDAATALARLHRDPPPLRSLRPNVSAELAAVVGRLMERDPNRRYSRANALEEALLGITSATGDPTASIQQPVASRPVPPLPPGAVSPTAGSGGPMAVPVEADHRRWAPPTHATHSTVGDQGRSQPGPRPGHTRVPAADAGPQVTGPAGGPAETRAQATGPATGRGQVTGPAGGPAGTRARGRSNGARPPSALDDHDSNEFEVLGVDRPSSAGASLADGRVVRSGRSRLIPLAVIALVVIGLVIAGVILTDIETRMGIGEEDPNPLDETGTGLSILALRSFDPQTPDDDKLEREEITGLAADGDRSTAWTTESYRRRGLGGLKDGVGLLISIEEPLPLNRIELETNTEGWSAEIYVGESFADDGSDWGEPVATVEAGSRRIERSLERAEGSVVLLWIRDTGVSGERIRFELAEVTLR